MRIGREIRRITKIVRPTPIELPKEPERIPAPNWPKPEKVEAPAAPQKSK